jgi:hypothetical protein
MHETKTFINQWETPQVFIPHIKLALFATPPRWAIFVYFTWFGIILHENSKKASNLKYMYKVEQKNS